ncbi:MAG: hypothetical protein M1837_002134 [Sclerophora amabilis]|nr:MAG: hypothetical protein M1837_002134 [Sclerophora amabilis]
MRSREQSASALLSALLLLAPSPASCFYIPGMAPNTYAKGDKVFVNVNHLTPGLSNRDTELRSVFAFDYYHPAFRFCQPDNGPTEVRESLGSILFGDRILTSPFELKMAENETCKALCEEVKFDAQSAKFVNRRIWQDYNINLIIDGLPAGQLSEDLMTHEQFYSPGFALGRDADEALLLNNHFDIMIDYHDAGNDRKRVVGVLVNPSSRKDAKNLEKGGADCGDPAHVLELSETQDTSVTWTYSVSWRPSSTAWATRWDKYLHVFDPKIHWFSLITSATMVILLTGTVVIILARALRKDIARYNRLDQVNLDDLSGAPTLDDGVQEDSGWKLVHGDVFRPPRHPMLLSIFLGNGAQLFVMTGITIVFALFGFLSPSNRGSLGTIMVLLYTIFSFIGGYVSTRVYNTFGGEAWKSIFLLTPLLIPGIVFSTFFLLNLFIWGKQSSGAVPFTTMLVIVGIWFIISVPLSVVGSFLGFRQKPIRAPVRTNQIPRQIPPSSTYLRPIPSMLMVGIPTFVAIFVELYFIMSSIWFSKVYYMFGFLFICYGLMTLTCAAVTILLVYFLLCSENYHWHWRAFFAAGTSALYVFLNALLYWVNRVSLGGFAGNLLYLGYSALISFLFFILTGSIGFFASWAFVQKIYGSIKVD